MMEHNISNAYTKTHNRTMRRGPTQQEAQERKVARQGWIKAHPELKPEHRLEAMPVYLRPK